VTGCRADFDVLTSYRASNLILPVGLKAVKVKGCVIARSGQG